MKKSANVTLSASDRNRTMHIRKLENHKVFHIYYFIWFNVPNFKQNLRFLFIYNFLLSTHVSDHSLPHHRAKNFWGNGFTKVRPL